MTTSNINTYFVPFIHKDTPRVYDAVVLPKNLLKEAKNFSNIFFFASGSFGCLSKREHKAGVRDKATNADIITDTAIVIANCWYNLPTIPGIKPTGTNTAASIKAIAITGADISFIAFLVASLGERPVSILCCTASTTMMASSTTIP